MITVEIRGTKAPSKKKDPVAYQHWRKTDPIWLLRRCLGNRLRSKHWRSAHYAKKKWFEAYRASAVIEGEPVEPPALVVVIHELPQCPDIDAPIKVLLDAIQGDVLTTKDDKGFSAQLTVRKKPESDPLVRVIVLSLTKEPYMCNQMLLDVFGNQQVNEIKKVRRDEEKREATIERAAKKGDSPGKN
jgi:hypothetical protein